MMELVAEGLNYPTGIAFDGQGIPHVSEAGLPFDGAPIGGRLLRIENGVPHCLIDGLRYPLNGVTYYKDFFYLSEGGNPGKLSRLSTTGKFETLLDDLPGFGNYQTNMTVVGPDEKLYFSQGAMTNSGIVGLDAYDLGWLKQLPHNVDIPGYPITLTGVNIETDNPVYPERGSRILTGAFSNFGTETQANQTIEAALPCTASVMRCELDGSNLEFVAWGLRNAYGLGFLPDGRLLALDQGADDRGSRPLGHCPDCLFDVRSGCWYGWPDFVAGRPVTLEEFAPTRGPHPTFLLNNHDELPEAEPALLEFPVNCAATKFDVVPSAFQDWGGHLLVTLFGDEKPMTAPPGPKVGRRLARVDMSDFSLHYLENQTLQRPIDVKFHPMSHDVYVVDFGEFEMEAAEGVVAQAGSGKLWKIPADQLIRS